MADRPAGSGPSVRTGSTHCTRSSCGVAASPAEMTGLGPAICDSHPGFWSCCVGVVARGVLGRVNAPATSAAPGRGEWSHGASGSAASMIHDDPPARPIGPAP